MTSKLLSHRGFAVYSDCEQYAKPIDVYGLRRKATASLVTAASDLGFSKGAGIEVEFSQWLPFAAPRYQISSALEDYVLVPVVIMPADLPNRNAVAFPLKELVKFNLEHGCLAYRTLIGKPMHVEHDNQDPTKAIGVIVDCALRLVHGYGNGRPVYKLIALLALDRTKNSVLANRILTGEQNSYSMGAWVGTIEEEPGYSCSYCGSEVGKCSHLDINAIGQFEIRNGILVFKNVHNLVFFETSSVATPAFTTALSDQLIIWRGK